MRVLASLAAAARERPAATPHAPAQRAPSLVAALERPGIIAELKPASPTQGAMRNLAEPEELARQLLAAGACGISALTEPTRFMGSPALLEAAVRAGGPVLMKDFVVTDRQLDLAQGAGASAVLLILPLLDATHSEWKDPAAAIRAAHERGLEVLLEVYDKSGLETALGLDADLIGINNRDLRDDALPVDREQTARVLQASTSTRPVIALSGVETPEDVRLHLQAGARGVLVGTSLMRADDPCQRLRELLEGIS